MPPPTISDCHTQDKPPHGDASSKNRAKAPLKAAEDGAHPNGVTLLIPNDRPGGGKLLAKRYDVIGNSVALTAYSKATFFTLSINQASGLRDFLRLLLHIESRPDIRVIRGAPIEGIERKRTRRTGNEIADVPRH